jgi:hypothetical protein
MLGKGRGYKPTGADQKIEVVPMKCRSIPVEVLVFSSFQRFNRKRDDMH